MQKWCLFLVNLWNLVGSILVANDSRGPAQDHSDTNSPLDNSRSTSDVVLKQSSSWKHCEYNWICMWWRKEKASGKASLYILRHSRWAPLGFSPQKWHPSGVVISRAGCKKQKSRTMVMHSFMRRAHKSPDPESFQRRAKASIRKIS